MFARLLPRGTRGLDSSALGRLHNRKHGRRSATANGNCAVLALPRRAIMRLFQLCTGLVGQAQRLRGVQRHRARLAVAALGDTQWNDAGGGAGPGQRSGSRRVQTDGGKGRKEKKDEPNSIACSDDKAQEGPGGTRGIELEAPAYRGIVKVPQGLSPGN